jgi:hypothetical protein
MALGNYRYAKNHKSNYAKSHTLTVCATCYPHKFLDFLKTNTNLEQSPRDYTVCTYIFDVAPDGVSLGEAVELGERVDGAQPGVELTKLSRNHTNLFTPSMCVSGSVRIDIFFFAGSVSDSILTKCETKLYFKCQCLKL